MNRILSIVVVVLVVLGAGVIAGCGEPSSTTGMASQPSRDPVNNSSELDVFIENETTTDIGEMI